MNKMLFLAAVIGLQIHGAASSSSLPKSASLSPQETNLLNKAINSAKSKSLNRWFASKSDQQLFTLIKLIRRRKITDDFVNRYASINDESTQKIRSLLLQIETKATKEMAKGNARQMTKKVMVANQKKQANQQESEIASSSTATRSDTMPVLLDQSGSFIKRQEIKASNNPQKYKLIHAAYGQSEENIIQDRLARQFSNFFKQEPGSNMNLAGALVDRYLSQKRTINDQKRDAIIYLMMQAIMENQVLIRRMQEEIYPILIRKIQEEIYGLGGSIEAERPELERQ